MNSKIGTDIHEVKPRYGGVPRIYILEKWCTHVGFELRVRRSRLLSVMRAHSAMQDGDSGEMVTTFIGPNLELLLEQAKSDLDNEILK